MKQLFETFGASVGYIVLFVTFAISITGLVFKTTEDSPNSKRKRLNNSGWFLLAFMLLLLGFNIYVNYQKEFSEQERKALTQKNEELETDKREQQLESLMALNNKS